MRVDDLRKTFEAAIGNLSPSKAQQMAKGLLEPGAAKDQVAKTATDLLEWSNKNRARLQTSIRREIQDQVRQMGLATHADVEALKKRVRDLERAAATGAAKRATTSRKKRTGSSSSRASASPSKPAASAPKPTTPHGPPSAPPSTTDEGGTGTSG